MPDPLLVEAAEKYGIPVGVLEGLAVTEGMTWDLVSVRGEVGRLQIHPIHAPTIKEQFGLEWGELRNRPDIQIAFQVPRLAQAWNGAKGQGGTDSEAAWAVVMLQAPADEYKPRQFESIMQALGYPGPNPIPPTSPITTPALEGGAVPSRPSRSDPKYMQPSDPLDPNSPRVFNEQYYSADVVAYETALQAPMVTKTMMEGEDDQDLGFYFDLVLDQWGREIEAGTLEVAQANVKLNKRLSALDQGRTMYQALLPRSLAPGAEYIPGREPGGLYEQMGLPSEKARTVSVNPMAAALALMGETPEMAAPTDLSFEAAIARAKQLMGEAGVGEAEAVVGGVGGGLGGAAVPSPEGHPAYRPPIDLTAEEMAGRGYGQPYEGPTGAPVGTATPDILARALAPGVMDEDSRNQLISLIEKMLGMDISAILSRAGRTLPVRGAKAWLGEATRWP